MNTQNQSAQNTIESSMGTDDVLGKSGWQPDGSYILDDSELLKSPYEVSIIEKPDADPNPPS
jgi:hypothetical protein